MNLIQELEKEQIAKLSAGKEIPDFQPGDTVIVNVKVVEGERSRVQAYEGVCIGRAGAGLNENFTVRKISYGEGVERVFPVYSPMIESIKIVRRGKVRRAKLLPAWTARQGGPHHREDDPPWRYRCRAGGCWRQGQGQSHGQGRGEDQGQGQGQGQGFLIAASIA